MAAGESSLRRQHSVHLCTSEVLETQELFSVRASGSARLADFGLLQRLLGYRSTDAVTR
jgi:hypothetical protein